MEQFTEDFANLEDDDEGENRITMMRIMIDHCDLRRMSEV